MPEMTFEVRWPDGSTTACYSPSLVMHDFLEVGGNYQLDDFVERSTQALQLASERVRSKYGYACTSAMQQQVEIRQLAAVQPAGEVAVLSMEPPLPVSAGAPILGRA
ncbi:MSMEG_0570 family nitrogen starvation response protein (plasmid) [Humibacter sp. BT305]|nr:MSMEG_0570 family nitrogen starvation response protein [Humibacter sp. BT305]